MEDPVLLRIAGAVATITLNRPKVLNALDGAMADGLAAAFERIEGETSLRVVVLAGAGAGFMAGAAIPGLQGGLALPPAAPARPFQPLCPRAHPLRVAV